MDLKNILGEVIFSAAVKTVKDLVTAAINAKADLQSADLQSANLQYADLQYANLQSANLQSAKLQYANLQYANLQYANLQSAKLQYANLQYANLPYADLQYANLQYADLQYANLQYANLQSAKNKEMAEAITSVLPEGNLVGWKKCRGDIIVKVLIPQRAKRSNSTGRKCRAEYVKVLQVFGGEVGISSYDEKTFYRKGEIVKCNTWNDDRWTECGGGIHFFITRTEAEAY